MLLISLKKYLKNSFKIFQEFHEIYMKIAKLKIKKLMVRSLYTVLSLQSFVLI